MTSTTRVDDGWVGRDACDRAGEKIGSINEIYYDLKTSRPGR